MTAVAELDIPKRARCAFCDYIIAARPFSIANLASRTAVLVTREQRGVGHMLVIPIAHAVTLLELSPSDLAVVSVKVREVAAAIARVFGSKGIAVWQNNGVDAQQAIPHVHFHVAGTMLGGGTEFGDVPEIGLDETDLLTSAIGAHISGGVVRLASQVAEMKTI